MQVDPIKLTLKEPEIKLLKLKSGKPLSNFAFKFHLRRYIKSKLYKRFVREEVDLEQECARYAIQALVAGAYTRPLFSSR